MDVDFSNNTHTNINNTPSGVIQLPDGSLQRMCGFFVPGGLVRIAFTQTDPTNAKGTIQLSCPGDLPLPLASVTELAWFILPDAPIPPNYGIMCYWQIASANASTGFELLGSLTPERPSQVFRTGWSEHEQLIEIMKANIPVIVTFALSVEPLTNIHNVEGKDHIHQQQRLLVAQKVASDLFKFMQSFDTGNATGGAPPGHMIVPTNIFDRWMKRFEARFQRDPNFFLKQDEMM